MSAMVNRIKALRQNRLFQGASTATVIMAATAAPAHAALDTAVSDAFTSLTSSIADYAAPAYGLMSAVLLFFIGLKWFKSVANKAT